MVNAFSLSTVKLSEHTLCVQGWKIQGLLEGGGGPSALLTEVYSQFFILSNYCIFFNKMNLLIVTKQSYTDVKANIKWISDFHIYLSHCKEKI